MKWDDLNGGNVGRVMSRRVRSLSLSISGPTAVVSEWQRQLRRRLREEGRQRVEQGASHLATAGGVSLDDKEKASCW